MLARAYSVKIGVFSMSGLKDEKLIKVQTYMKTETRKLYSRDFWIFLPKIIKIDLYNSELYRFKVDAFFETQCSYFSIRFYSNRAQLFKIFEYLPSPISNSFNRMTPIFHLSKHA